MPVRPFCAALLAFALLALVFHFDRVDLAPLERASRVELPEVPRFLAPEPSFQRVRVHLFESPGLVDATAEGFGAKSVALRGPGAVALVDGRVLASDPAAVRSLLERLHWHELPLSVANDSASRQRTLLVGPTAPLAWRAQLGAFLAARAVRDWLQSRALLAVATLCVLALLAAAAAARSLARSPDRREVEGVDEAAADRPISVAADRRGAYPPVASSPWGSLRVVLVSDREALRAARIAIGEEHVIAGNRDAFAFARGWILAVRESSIFELVTELGWGAQTLSLLRPGDALPDGNPWNPGGPLRAGGALDVVDALQLCGPIADSSGIAITASAA